MRNKVGCGEMSTALGVATDRERTLVANGSLKRESWKGIGELIDGDGLYYTTIDDDREDGESSNREITKNHTIDDVAAFDDTILANSFKKEVAEEVDEDESFASVMQSAKHTLKLIRMAQQQEREIHATRSKK
jgi:hypothetical protein